MLKDLRVTLYDVFGYLVPGAILTGALAIGYLAIYHQHDSVMVDLGALEIWLTLGVFSYVNGHVSQAIGNLASSFWSWTDQRIVDQLPSDVRKLAVARLKEHVGVDTEQLGGRWVFELCDDAVVRSGKAGEREIYIYREGFYRGNAVAFALMTIAILGLFLKLYVEKWSDFTLGSWLIHRHQLIFFATVSATWSILCLRRYWRFMDYRVRHSVLGFLLLSSPFALKEKPNVSPPSSTST